MQHAPAAASAVASPPTERLKGAAYERAVSVILPILQNDNSGIQATPRDTVISHTSSFMMEIKFTPATTLGQKAIDDISNELPELSPYVRMDIEICNPKQTCGVVVVMLNLETYAKSLSAQSSKASSWTIHNLILLSILAAFLVWLFVVVSFDTKKEWAKSAFTWVRNAYKGHTPVEQFVEGQ